MHRKPFYYPTYLISKYIPYIITIPANKELLIQLNYSCL